MSDTNLTGSGKPRVLFVEDNETYRKIVKNTMVLFGLEVVEAADGKQGLELAQSFKPDLVLSDVYMPVMDGMTMLVELKKNSQLSQIPVVMVTNVQEELDLAVKAGAEEAVLKSSLTPQQLIDVCKKHLAPELAAQVAVPPATTNSPGPATGN